MKKIIRKIQDLGQRAAQIKEVIERAPAQAAQLRESVRLTAGHLQQMRTDVQSAVTGLRADNDDRLTQALHEIDEYADTFHEAGYQLMGVDLEVCPVHRLLVHLMKVDSASEPALRSLISAHVGHPTISALLASLSKADALTDDLRLSNLSYYELVVQVGPTPSVRLCWRTDEVMDASEEPATPMKPVSVSVATASAPSFGPSAFFEPRPNVHSSPTTPAAAVPPTEPDAVPAVVRPIPAVSVRPHSGSDWKQGALDRFKKMPDVSKYRR